MAQQQESRRVRMTKRLMKEALLELMEEKDLMSITVTAICETADVHRSTFYNYYMDPADLFREIEQDFLDRIPTPSQILKQNNQKAILEATTVFFDFMQENKKTLQILFNNSSSNNFSARLIEHLCNGYIPVEENPNKLEEHFRRIYIANGTVGMMREWVNQGFPVSSRKIAEMMYFLSTKISQN